MGRLGPGPPRTRSIDLHVQPAPRDRQLRPLHGGEKLRVGCLLPPRLRDPLILNREQALHQRLQAVRNGGDPGPHLPFERPPDIPLPLRQRLPRLEARARDLAHSLHLLVGDPGLHTDVLHEALDHLLLQLPAHLRILGRQRSFHALE
jgi:hypothetical protein